MLCRGGQCLNSVGSFRCVCPDGFELMPGGEACKDIDECGQDSSICSNGHCENVMGGYQCFCNDGYKPSPNKISCLGEWKMTCIVFLIFVLHLFSFFSVAV